MGNKIAIGLGIVGIIGGIILVARKAEAGPEGPPRYATLYGTVTDFVTGEGIGLASVSLNGLGTMTEADGFYVLEDIGIWENQNTFTLIVEKAGYQRFQRGITLLPGFKEYNLEL